ncbi:hypothetical protein VMCG_07882 [Cytospora schulzeri]|uniref:Uncharacterized protein n=1 Tax=Cytospora schulzeri TaxID=448051 RepID=A0A423W0D1_9PEZI|nr:hypothetical protein VMCG_07882 [Valsa malicola]
MSKKLTFSARHYSYECKTGVQERPYNPRPSRTQQLLNPKLVPKLTNEAPDSATKKKGVADEELAKKEAERARKRDLEDDDEMGLREHDSKRQRSSSVGEAGLSTPLATSVMDDLPAQSETTALVTIGTMSVQGLGQDHVTVLSSGNVLLLVLDATHPSLMASGPKGVTGGTIQDRRVVQLPETDGARMGEPTGNIGIDTMARTKAGKSPRGEEPLHPSPSHHGSAV